MAKDIEETKIEIIKHMRQEYRREPEKYKDRLKTIDLFENNSEKTKKVDIKETFGFYKELKDGSQGKILVFPDIEEMHTDPKHVTSWVDYSTFDAEITYFLRETLAKQLEELITNEENMQNLGVLYTKYWLPFGELLTDMERAGFRIDVDYLKEIELMAERDKI
jgi:DNA polymerase I